LWADTSESPIGDCARAAESRRFVGVVDQPDLISKRRTKSVGAEDVSWPGGLRGLFEGGGVLRTRRSGEGFEKAIGSFEEATRKDPNRLWSMPGCRYVTVIIGATITGDCRPIGAAGQRRSQRPTRARDFRPLRGEAETSWTRHRNLSTTGMRPGQRRVQEKAMSSDPRMPRHPSDTSWY